MTRLSHSALLALLVLAPSLALATTPTDSDAPLRPDDEAGELLPSDGLAECASILAVASSQSRNLVQRKNMERAAATWFAASGDLAAQEGALPEPSVWEEKVNTWAGRIGSVDAMSKHTTWVRYCTYVGAERGLEISPFHPNGTN